VSTLAHYIRRNSESTRTGLLFEDESFTHAEIVTQASQRAAFLLEQRSTGPFHVGVLLDNVPEAIFWLEAAGLVGAAAVGINSTRRGAELAGDILHTDCLFVVTDPAGTGLLAEAHIDRPVWVTGSPEYETALGRFEGATLPDVDVSETDPFVLIFTSGTTSAPKAAICSHSRIVRVASGSVERMGITADDVAYNSMPWCHSNALYVTIATSIVAGCSLAMRHRFSASGWLPDVKRYGVTYFNYVGKPLEYILATPESPDDADNRLRFGLGNEANERDIDEFGKRFGVTIIDGFGSTEMGVVISRTPDMPAGSLGRARDDDTVGRDPATGVRRQRPSRQPRRGHRRAREQSWVGLLRGLLQERGRQCAEVPAWVVLVGGPGLPGPGGLLLLRRPGLRLAPSRWRKLRRGPHRAHTSPLPWHAAGGRVRSPGPPRRRSSHGRHPAS
jgi:fatty-acyl-CoA synthase